MHLQQEFFDIEDDIRDILSHAWNSRKFVVYSFNLYGSYGSPFKGGQENAPQSIAHRRTKSSFKWFCREASKVVRSGCPVDFNALRHLELG